MSATLTPSLLSLHLFCYQSPLGWYRSYSVGGSWSSRFFSTGDVSSSPTLFVIGKIFVKVGEMFRERVASLSQGNVLENV